MNIKKTPNSRLSGFDWDNFSFGDTFTDHMVICEYENGEWKEPQLLPYGPISFTPAMMAVNYGQACFEGMKAYKDKNDDIFLFRIDKNYDRINKSSQRLGMPKIPKEIFYDGLYTLVDVDRGWVPYGEGLSLYLRPLIFATEEMLKARPAEKFLFAIVASPAKVYYSDPVAVKISDYYSRAASGGVGFAKAAGNYAASFLPTYLAQEEGYDQIIWTDDATHEKIEESGTMNVFVRIHDTLFTPPISDRILDGVTRDSFITLAKRRGIAVREENIYVNDLLKAYEGGTLQEIWGVGTAVVANSFKSFGYKDKRYPLPVLSEADSYASLLKKELVDIQTNLSEDAFGWRYLVEKKC
ncbi:MAG: branched-chain amino acid aminotransferase [Bergeyella sp.]|nr:branched-chain amino acid aminotransferase [Bergeyella sp.]